MRRNRAVISKRLDRGISPAFQFARERELGETLEAFAPAVRGVLTTFVLDMTPFCVIFLPRFQLRLVLIIKGFYYVSVVFGWVYW